MKLNLGSGNDIKEGFINIDIRELPGVDLVSDIRKLPYLPESIDEINAYDVLEHFSFKETVYILKYWISFLKPGGLIIIRVPDLAKILNKFLTGQLPTFEAQRLVFGGQTHNFDYHSAGFSEGMLEGMLLASGCSEVIQAIREETSHNITLVARK